LNVLTKESWPIEAAIQQAQGLLRDLDFQAGGQKDALFPFHHSKAAVDDHISIPYHWLPLNGWELLGDKQRSSCNSKACVCPCHVQRRWLKQGLLGGIAFSRISYTDIDHKCDVTSRNGIATKSSIAYHLPMWMFFRRMVATTYETTLYGQKHHELTFPRIVYRDALIFHYASTNNINGIKKLFQKGIAAPSDVRFDSGWTALHFALEANSLDVADFLIKQGAKPWKETTAPSTATYLAMAKIYSKPVDPNTSLRLRIIFRDFEGDDMGFSQLHEHILGIKELPESQLRSLPAEVIHKGDFLQRTPLSWAAQRGDTDSVSFLLRLGANDGHQDLAGNTPIHYAAQSRHPNALIRLLDKNNRFVNTKNTGGWTPLHHAAYNQSDPVYVNTLLKYGAYINSTTKVGKTPLMLATLRKLPQVAAALLDAGVEVNTQDINDWTALKLAIKDADGNVEIMDMLLRAGATVGPDAQLGETALHYAARDPSVEVFEALKKVPAMRDIDVQSRNKEGLTARELLAEQCPTIEISLAFENLCRALEKPAITEKVLSETSIPIKPGQSFKQNNYGQWALLLLA
jgi:ankyrin repeat protein